SEVRTNDLLVLSCGVTPRTELATLAGLRTAVGVVVHPWLQTWSDPAVYAIGDCAHIAERTGSATDGAVVGAPSGLIGPGWRQAEWRAARFAADARAAVVASTAAATTGASRADATAATGSIRPAAHDDAVLPPEREAIVMLKAEHLDVVAVGDVSADPWDDDPATPRRRVAQWADPEHGRYVKMVTEDGVLTAFATVGMPRTAAELTLLYDRCGELPADRSLLLRLDGPDDDPGSATASLSPTATVCWCNGVSAGRIEEVAACGATTVEAVGRETRAGTGCGGCRSRIEELLARTADGAASAAA
ncbi:MAG TPA: (2Fe-2S)-binding protein, partial [Agromyces sp.]